MEIVFFLLLCCLTVLVSYVTAMLTAKEITINHLNAIDSYVDEIMGKIKRIVVDIISKHQ